MTRRGWLLDPYIRGKEAHLWFKTVGRRDTPPHREAPPQIFVAQPTPGLAVEDLCYRLEEHKMVHSAEPVDRYTSISKERLERVAEVRVDSSISTSTG